MTESVEARIDSLPYVEAIHEDYEEYALSLIEEEMKQFQPRPLKRKLQSINFRTPMMKAEYAARIVDNEFQARERKSYQPSKITRPTSLDKWRDEALPRAKALFETERLRSVVLDAEKDEAVENWKSYNAKVLEQIRNQSTKVLADQREAVEEVNFNRQQSQQQQYGPQLEQLNTDYQQMLYRRNQLEHSIEGLRRIAASKNAA